MFCRVLLSRLINNIVFSFFPVDMKLILLLSVVNPIKYYAHCFGFALNNVVGYDDKGTFVVELYWCWFLLVAHFMSCSVNGNSIY